MAARKQEAFSRTGTINLRHAFVAFLFSLVAAEIARSAGTLIHAISDERFAANQIAPSAHLFLALIVVTTSWVGWSKSALKNDTPRLTNVFQDTYIALLLDVILVIVYFGLTRSAEIDSTRDAIRPASASNEATLIAIIFAIYFVWDLWTDVWMRRVGEPRLVSIKKVLICGSASLISLLAVWWARCVYTSHPEPSNVLAVYAADAALLSVVIGFRALKGIEEQLANYLNVPVGEYMKVDFSWQMRSLIYWSAYLLFIGSIKLSACWVS